MMIGERLNRLRSIMHNLGIHYYIVPTSDPHDSEYVCPHYRVREYLSGFTGSAGTLLVTAAEAFLWTDGRYFLQVQEELASTGIQLMKSGLEGVPDIYDWVRDHMKPGEALCFDTAMTGYSMGSKLGQIAVEKNGYLLLGEDPMLIPDVWPDRPGLPERPIELVPEEYVGQSVAEKLADLRRYLDQNQKEAIFISPLDEVMWLFNIRGGDIPHCPVGYSYALVDRQDAFLMLTPGAISPRLESYLQGNGVTLVDYYRTYDFLRTYIRGRESLALVYDRRHISYCMDLFLANITGAVSMNSCIDQRKSIKHPRELAHIRDCYVRDSAAVFRFIYMMKKYAGLVPGQEAVSSPGYEEYFQKPDEASCAGLINRLRAEQDGWLDLSFTTIAAYGPNAAIVHYDPPGEGSAAIEKKGMLLLDSGGQYLGATTDVTRTISLGEVGYREKELFTAVLSGMLRLSQAVFPKGTTGRNLDILARSPLWEKGLDYLHGTGHGVGYMLNVHEGPQYISHRARAGQEEVALSPGMLISDEPGVYLQGQFGIRTENILEVIEAKEPGFLCFGQLTYVPIDRDLILKEELKEDVREVLNAYHRSVREKLSPLLNSEERQYLDYVTAEI